MSEIKRYSLESVTNRKVQGVWLAQAVFNPADDGEWCKADDVSAIERRARIAERALELACESMVIKCDTCSEFRECHYGLCDCMKYWIDKAEAEESEGGR